MQYFRSGPVPTTCVYLGGLRPYNAWNTVFTGGVPDHVWLSGVPVDWTYYKTVAGYTVSSEPYNQEAENVLVLYYDSQFFIGDNPDSHALNFVCEFSLM